MAFDAGTGLSNQTKVLMIAALALTVAHHADHVLRVDHSGWPFKPEVTPFTFSLLAYPMIFFALLGPNRLFWWRWAFLLFGTLSTIVAHTMLETPAMQYAMWADNQSLDPHCAGIHNLLDTHSATMGWISMSIAMTLNALAVLSTGSMLIDGLRSRA
jgi:hypothetical protein